MANKPGRKVSKTKLFHIDVEAAQRLEDFARLRKLSQTEILEKLLTEPGLLESLFPSAEEEK
jgi:hypothetical protein